MTQQAEILQTLSEMSERAKTNTLTQKDKMYIKNIHSIVLRKEFVDKNCGECYKEAFANIFNFLKKNFIMTTSNYKLKRGVVAQSGTMSATFTNENITDELANQFISENPQRLNFFEFYPKKWDRNAIKLGLKTVPKPAPSVIPPIETETTETETEQSPETVTETEVSKTAENNKVKK
jgi:hypothetical protein